MLAYIKIFETKRLLIREYQLSDLNAIHEYAGDPSVMQYQNWGPNEREDTLAFLREAIEWIETKPRLTYEYCIELKEGKKVIGGCGIFRKAEHLQAAKIGYILNPKYWKRGYATEAVEGLVEHAQEDLKIETIRATCDQLNIGSARVLEKNDFVLEKLIENDYEQKGKVRNSLLFKYSP